MNSGPYLVENELAEVRHVTLVRHRTLIVVFKVFLQSHGVMGHPQHCAQVMGQHLRKSINNSHQVFNKLWEVGGNLFQSGSMGHSQWNIYP